MFIFVFDLFESFQFKSNKAVNFPYVTDSILLFKGNICYECITFLKSRVPNTSDHDFDF